uniref:RGS domain-containing protein n=1 Tax=Timema tahoe TaxID=61484 RepID=A0A7R9ISS6_9NEOP|nr:unnamed protein product [Timema tahoe]
MLSVVATSQHPNQDSRLVRQESELGVTSWSTSLEKLLEDPLGLHTFAVFVCRESCLHLVNALNEDDPYWLVVFSEVWFAKLELVHHMIGTDEAKFNKTGSVNHHNCVYWHTENSHLDIEVNKQSCCGEFLKKEFSHENIYFWVACERYRGLQGSLERKSAAREIFNRHLCLGALEPVNVDSHARQVTQEGLEDASQQLFLQAQKQIFNLMKFDSYPRFIKSALYKECMVRQLSGESVQYPGGNQELHIETSTAPSTPTSHSKVCPPTHTR